MFDADRRARLLRDAALTLIVFSCAYLFFFANLSLSGEGLRLYAGGDGAAQIAGGAWARPVYERIRGGISSPFLTGALSAAYLMAECLLLSSLLNLQSFPLRVILAGLLILHPAAAEIVFLRSGHADAIFLSALAATLGAWCFFRVKHGGFLLAIMGFAASAALEPSMLPYGPVLLPVVMLRSVLAPDSSRDAALSVKNTALALLGMPLAALPYTAGLLFMCRRYGLAIPVRLRPDAFLPELLRPFLTYLKPYTAYPHIAPVLWILLFISAAVFTVRFAARRRTLIPAALLLVWALAYAALPVCFLPSSSVMRLTDPLLGVFLLAFCAICGNVPKRAGAALAAAVAALFLGQIVYENQLALLANLEYHATASFATRVLDRIERTEGFKPGQTPVALLGAMSDSPLAVPHQGFEALEAFPMGERHFSGWTESDNAPYFWQILGYPLNLVSEGECDRIRLLPEAQKMPVFPEEGSVRFLEDGTLIVRLAP